MSTQQSVLAIIAAFCITGSAMAQAGNCTQKDGSTRPDCPGALAFFHTFQSAFRQQDRAKIASLVAYPALTKLNHKQIRIRNQRQLLAHFSEIFDRGVRCTVLNATESDVWGNWRGFTIGRGAIWFDAVIPRGEQPDTNAPDFWTKYPFKVITINNDAEYPCRSDH